MVPGANRPEAKPAVRPARGRGPHPARARLVAPILFLALVGGATALGIAAYRREVESARRELQRQVLAVGRLKASEIARWLVERSEDAQAAATGSRVATGVERWQATGRLAPEERAWMEERLDAFRIHGDYLGVAALGRDGSLLLSAGGRPFRLPAIPQELAREVMATGEVRHTSLRRPGGPQDPLLAIDFIAPLTAMDAAGARTVGALLFRVDARRYLCPFVQSWPIDSPSAESLLVERDGDDVLYLNDLRHRAGSALWLRQPLDAPELISAQGLRGVRGVTEGVDYRGVPVLGAIEDVEGSRWILVAKVDRSEAYAPLRDFVWLFALFLVASAATAGLAVRARLRDVRAARLRREHEGTKEYVAALEVAEVEREALIASLTKALDDVRTLRGIVPICASCKRVRDDAGFWRQVEAYVAEHTQAQFSHGVCPECERRLYGEGGAPPPGEGRAKPEEGPAARDEGPERR